MQRIIGLVVSSFVLVACGVHEGPGMPRPETCGDAIVQIENGETCDDGNFVDGDGCSSTCTFEEVASSACGDGIIGGTEEACDDGNLVDGDGCSGSCEIEQGYECEADQGECKPVCGDGLLRPGEVCDDGNVLSDDGCSSDCQAEADFECAVAGQPCVPA